MSRSPACPPSPLSLTTEAYTSMTLASRPLPPTPLGVIPYSGGERVSSDPPSIDREFKTDDTSGIQARTPTGMDWADRLPGTGSSRPPPHRREENPDGDRGQIPQGATGRGTATSPIKKRTFPGRPRSRALSSQMADQLRRLRGRAGFQVLSFSESLTSQ